MASRPLQPQPLGLTAAEDVDEPWRRLAVHEAIQLVDVECAVLDDFRFRRKLLQ